MKYTEIIKLLDAGYTRDEILEMDEPEPVPQENEPDTKAQENEPVPAAQAQNPDLASQTGNVTVAEDVFNDLKELFSDMKKEFTAFNIMTSRQAEEKTGEDIIANIINPFERGGNKDGRS